MRLNRIRNFAIAAALLFVPVGAHASGFGGGSAGGSSVDFSALTDSAIPQTDNAITLGNSTHRYSGIFVATLNCAVLTAPSGLAITVTSDIADGASAKAIILNGTNLANATSKILVLQAAGTDKFFFRKDGAFAPNTFGGGTLGTNALYWQTLYTNEIVSGNGTLQSADGYIRFQFNYTGGTTFVGQSAASGVGFTFKNQNAITSGNYMVHYSDNGTTLIREEDFGGSTRQGAVTLRTCASGIEGMISRDAAAGGTSGHLTRVCLCTSDGAGTPVYKWQNMVSGTLGTTTTCAD